MQLNIFILCIYLTFCSSSQEIEEVKTIGNATRISLNKSNSAQFPTLIVLGDELQNPPKNTNIVNIVTRRGFYSHFPDINGDLYGIQQALKWLVEQKKIILQKEVYLVGNGPFGSQQAIYIASLNKVHMTPIFSTVVLINPDESVLKAHTLDQFEDRVVYPLAEELGCLPATKSVNEAADCIKKNKEAPNVAEVIGIKWRPVIDNRYVFINSMSKLPKPVYVLTDGVSCCGWLVVAKELENFTTVITGNVNEFLYHLSQTQQCQSIPPYNYWNQQMQQQQQQNEETWYNMLNSIMRNYWGEGQERPRRRKKRYYIEEQPVSPMPVHPPPCEHYPVLQHQPLPPPPIQRPEQEQPKLKAPSEECFKKEQVQMLVSENIKMLERRFSEYYNQVIQCIQQRDQVIISGLREQLGSSQKELADLKGKLEAEKEKLVKREQEIIKKESENIGKSQCEGNLRELHDHICYLIELYENLVALLTEDVQAQEHQPQNIENIPQVKPTTQQNLQPRISQPTAVVSTVRPHFDETQTGQFFQTQAQVQQQTPVQMTLPFIAQPKEILEFPMEQFKPAPPMGPTHEVPTTATQSLMKQPTIFEEPLEFPRQGISELKKKYCNKHEFHLVY